MTFSLGNTVRTGAAALALLAAGLMVTGTAGRAAIQEPRDAMASDLRRQVPDFATLVRATPNIYLIRIDSVEPDLTASRAGNRTLREVKATVERTLKGKPETGLTLTVPQGAWSLSPADAMKLQEQPVFYSTERFLTSRNPMLDGPDFRADGRYLVFLDADNDALRGGPYGYQPVASGSAFWVQTIEGLVADPDRGHAVDMSFRDFLVRYRSVFLLAVADCLGTEVSISEPVWGEPVRRDEIVPEQILPESAQACADAPDRPRGWLGLIEARPWLYAERRAYPNQRYLAVRDGMVDFSELDLDIGFPGDGRIAVADLARRMSTGAER